VLSIASVEKRFGSVQVLKKIDLEARQGEFLVLLGPSGCGKTTLLGIIAGLESASSGDIIIDRQVVTDLEPKDRDIAMVFQSYALYPSMTVAHNLCFGMKVRGVPRDKQAEAVTEVARILHLEALLNRKPARLSGGQRQRVAMGRALVRHPKIFLFDEPLSNLDAQLRVEMRTELKKLHARLNATIVYVTHYQVEAMTLATKVAVMNGGVLQQVGLPQEIYDRPTNTFVARFIGSPSMNLLLGVIADADGIAAVRLGEGSEATTLVTTHPRAVAGLATGTPILLGVRPEAIHQERGLGAPQNNVIEVTIDIVEPTGSDQLAFFRIGGQEASARLQPQSCSPSERVALRFPPEKLLLFDAESGVLIA
jgi:multiple sugar transport system ATP-binding protein